MTERERSATLHSTKSDAELIEYGRDVIRTMKANGYGGIVWDEVLDRFERLKVQSATETLRVRCQPCGRITSDEGRCPDCPDRGTEPPPPQEARAPSATTSAWISVEDRLPEEKIDVLVLDHAISGEPQIQIATYLRGLKGYNHQWMFNIKPWQSGPNYHRVTHWMPLPEAPK